MKAARLHGPRDIRLDDVPCPSPGEGQVLIRVRGRRPVRIGPALLHRRPDRRYRDVGAADPRSRVRRDDRGGRSRRARARGRDARRGGPGRSVRPLRVLRGRQPEHLPDRPLLRHAAHRRRAVRVHRLAGAPGVPAARLESTPSKARCWRRLASRCTPSTSARCGSPSRVAVLGQGPIGLLIARLAKVSGAVEVYASEVNPTRLAASGSFGADVVIDSRAEDPVARVKALTGGRGVDVVFETAGSLVTPQQAVDMVKPGGTVVIVGINPDDRIPLKHTAARRKGVTIRMCRRMKHVYRRCIDLVTHDLVDPMPLVSGRYPLVRDRRRVRAARGRGPRGDQADRGAVRPALPLVDGLKAEPPLRQRPPRPRPEPASDSRACPICARCAWLPSVRRRRVGRRSPGS